jgi:hypothetical protein
MFGLSLPKLIVLALIIGAVWYGYKWFESRGASRKGGSKDNQAAKPGPADSAADSKADSKDQELVACTVCGTYVSPEIKTCPDGRADCPSVGR